MKIYWKKFCKYFWRGVLIFIGFSFLKGCWGIFYVKMTHLTDEELTWVTSPIKYERGTFESDSGNHATFIMLTHGISNSKNPFFFNIVESDRYEARAMYKYLVRLPKAHLDGFFVEYKSLENDSLVFWAMLNYKYSFYQNSIEAQQITLQNKLFTNCLVIDSLNSEPYNRKVNYPIEKYIISKDYGLIYFQLESGERYYREFKTSGETDF